MNLVSALEHVSESATNSNSVIPRPRPWTAERESCEYLQARVTQLEQQYADLEQQFAQRRDLHLEDVLDYNQLVRDFNELADKHDQLVKRFNKCRDFDRLMDAYNKWHDYAIEIKAKYVKATQDADFLKHWVRDLKEEREAAQQRERLLQRQVAFLLTLAYPTATVDRGYHTPARRGRGRGVART